ncbi:MAG TPA: M14 family metallopeptidase, partial [Salinivirgaceae bacterium]|nr:M14 family metallopeptidase [Salinivirgaceae bacterium]
MKQNHFFPIVAIWAIIALLLLPIHLTAQNVTAPKEFFGYEPGSDRKLINYQKLVDYFKTLERQSKRISIYEIGKSHFNNPIFVVAISSEENIGQLETLKAINKTLAIDVTLTDEKAQELAIQGKVFVLGTLSMHSNEVGPSQAAPIIAYRLLSTQNPDTLSWLKNTVYLMVPCHNPDGLNMVSEWYTKTIGTTYEGTIMPGIYHKYAGHDINRDFVMLTQPENMAVSKLTSHEWFPQVMVEKHQMGMTGPRYFVPPNHDPIAENVDETLWSWIGVFGSAMLNDMTNNGLQGIAQQYEFDNYWPGSTETCLWKNVISLLTEAASVNYATPVFLEKNELKVWGKGLSEYEKSVKFVAPWEGGWWRLSDIVKYEVNSTFSLIKTASLHKNAILKSHNDLCKKEFEKGKNSPPYYYILPHSTDNKSGLRDFVKLMVDHGITIHKLTKDVTIDRTVFYAEDIVISLAQPFRSFIKEVMETQKYPERHYTLGGAMIRPYDITSWSLPLNFGIVSYEITTKSTDLESALIPITQVSFQQNLHSEGKFLIFSPSDNESYKVAFLALSKGEKVFRLTSDYVEDGKNHIIGSFVLQKSAENLLKGLNLAVSPTYVQSIPSTLLTELKMPSIGLVESWFQDMDAGWTRYLFDTYGIPFKVVRPSELADLNLQKNFQILIFPNQESDLLMTGKRKRENDYYTINLETHYAKGIGRKGMSNILKFVDSGGTVLTWGQSTNLFMGMLEIEIDKENQKDFKLPISNVMESLTKRGLEISGSHLLVNAVENHPLTYGMPRSFPIFVDDYALFETAIPSLDTDRRVILSFPKIE